MPAIDVILCGICEFLALKWPSRCDHDNGFRGYADEGLQVAHMMIKERMLGKGISKNKHAAVDIWPLARSRNDNANRSHGLRTPYCHILAELGSYDA